MSIKKLASRTGSKAKHPDASEDLPCTDTDAEVVPRFVDLAVRAVHGSTGPAGAAEVTVMAPDMAGEAAKWTEDVGTGEWRALSIVNRRGILALARNWCSHAETQHADVFRFDQAQMTTSQA